MISSQRYMQCPDTAARQSPDGGAVLVNLETKTYCRLNRTSLTIWIALQSPKSIIELVNILESQYDEVPETLPTDVEAALGALLENGFLMHAL